MPNSHALKNKSAALSMMSPPFAAPLILMIDDTPANLGIVAEHFEEHGFRVAVAQDGEEGARRAEFIQPDLILLDVMMPGMDGFDTCHRLKAAKKTRDIPVIFMTALADTCDKLAGFAAGGVDYVTKPFQIEEVLARVNTHLALSAARKRLAEQNGHLQQEIAMREKAETALQRANDVLEERVAERTAELAQTNINLRAEIADRKQAEGRIRYMAHHDALTGLPNRVLLEDRLNQAIAQARRHQHEMVALLFIDLDYFKTINDSLGHQIGDRLLQQVAIRLQQCLREGDSVARLGGDEFVISLPALSDSSDAALVAAKVLATLDIPFAVEGHELHVGGSIGISLYPADGKDVQTLMRAADAAMYHAKQKGRSNYQFYTSTLNEAAQRRLTVANQLRQALAQGEFVVYYQPQVEMGSGKIFSAEALLRLNLPGNGPVSCGEFISIAEETGLILPIGEWVLRQACTQLKRWHDEGHPEMHVAVNLSARQFFQVSLADVVGKLLREFDLPAQALDLEITESVLMQPSQDNMAIMQKLSTMGVQLSIDDFGTGYSSLAYLQDFPIHALKIDRSFITRIGNNGHDNAIVTAILAMAHNLNLKVVAEGVDNAAQATFLMAHGCSAAQGFYYCKPVPAQSFADMMRDALPPLRSGGSHEKSGSPSRAQ
jgi:diguanylate cyclase (GGDEF)-like protein